MYEINRDWQDQSIATIRGVLSEAVAAELVNSWAAEGESVRWLGGTNPGFDIIFERYDRTFRYEAKAVRVHNGLVELTRADAKPFDPDKTDIVVLVHSDVHTGFASELGTAQNIHLSATLTVHDVWVLSVEEINALMAESAKDDKGVIRIVKFTVDELAHSRRTIDGLPDSDTPDGYDDVNNAVRTVAVEARNREMVFAARDLISPLVGDLRQLFPGASFIETTPSKWALLSSEQRASIEAMGVGETDFQVGDDEPWTHLYDEKGFLVGTVEQRLNLTEEQDHALHILSRHEIIFGNGLFGYWAVDLDALMNNTPPRDLPELLWWRLEDGAAAERTPEALAKERPRPPKLATAAVARPDTRRPKPPARPEPTGTK